jgi:hypothetical protein
MRQAVLNPCCYRVRGRVISAVEKAINEASRCGGDRCDAAHRLLPTTMVAAPAGGVWVLAPATRATSCPIQGWPTRSSLHARRAPSPRYQATFGSSICTRGYTATRRNARRSASRSRSSVRRWPPMGCRGASRRLRVRLPLILSTVGFRTQFTLSSCPQRRSLHLVALRPRFEPRRYGPIESCVSCKEFDWNHQGASQPGTGNR